MDAPRAAPTGGPGGSASPVGGAASPASFLRPTAAGRLLAFASTVVLAAVAGEWRALGVLLLALLLAAVLSRAAFARAARDRTLLPLALLSLGMGAFMGQPDLWLGPLPVYAAGLSLGAQMMVRAMAILLAVYTLTTSLSLSTVAHLFERVGLSGLGFALGVAVNALPIVQRNFHEASTALRLRGGFRRRRLHSLRLLLLTTTVNSVRHAEDIVAAAEARGFQGGQVAPNRLTWRSGDWALLAALIAAAALLLRA